VILHYEREIELLKIKVSRLYEADIEALRNLFTHQLEQLSNENAKLKETLTQTKDRLIQEVEEKLLMRKDYENRLNEMNVKYDREHKQLNDLLMLAEKNYENVRSQTSIRDIEHGSKLKSHNISLSSIMLEKRNLENQIKNKNKEIEELNLRIEKMNGYHKRDLEQLQARLAEEQAKYRKFLDEQAKSAKASADEAESLRAANRAL
jgi:DNA repair exonuclease SbcCD ATPase subunit